MGLAVLAGLATGLILNFGADRLPPSAESRARGTNRGQVARWAGLLLLSAALFVHLHGRYGWGLQFMVQTTYCSLLLLIAAIDLEHSMVPNVLVLAGLILALAFNALSPVPGLAGALSGAATGGGIFVLLALIRRNALGLGDVKLAFLVGMMTGFPWVLQAMVLSTILGGLAAGLLLLLRLRGPGQYMPYAPYLVAGSMATLLYGQRIVIWYAHLAWRGG